jgi:hypothetical protein
MIVNFQFDPAKVDNLGDGIRLFSVGNRGTADTRSTGHSARFYDLNANFAIKVAISNSLFHGVSTLHQYQILLHMLFKSLDPLTIEYDL